MGCLYVSFHFSTSLSWLFSPGNLHIQRMAYIDKKQMPVFLSVVGNRKTQFSFDRVIWKAFSNCTGEKRIFFLNIDCVRRRINRLIYQCIYSPSPTLNPECRPLEVSNPSALGIYSRNLSLNCCSWRLEKRIRSNLFSSLIANQTLSIMYFLGT